CLSEFDEIMNEGDCTCIRYIDDILILAPTKRAASARLKRAKQYLENMGMRFSTEKTSTEPISVQHTFEYLGVEFSNGLLRANKKSRRRLIESVSLAFDKSCKSFSEATKSGADVERGMSLVHTLRKVDGIINGWGKHYRFCNDVRTLNDLDKQVSELIRSYIGRYSDIRGKADEKQWRSLLGIASLSTIERTPLQWPKVTRAR
ncbi:MAG: reverse transcriptase domain-containing protein, partial [Brevundimonas sp.]|uniref:reverse transcriptase domain-containing protein n=1 Tax=Brevundimonas sp. TaxID=1871086 RepID=UPI0040341A6E